MLALFVIAMSSVAATRPGRGRNKVRTRLIPRFYDFSHCKDKDHSLRVTNFTVIMDRKGLELWTVAFDLLTSSKNMPGLKLLIWRCTGGQRGSCEYFNTWTWEVAVCHLLVARDMPWTPLVHNIFPPFGCPANNGTYATHNATLDFDILDQAMKGLNLEKYTWRVEAQVQNDQRMLFICFAFAAELRRIRIRD